MAAARPLHLVSERKIGELLPHSRSDERWEASGVLALPPHFLVVFDDRTKVARLSSDLNSVDANNLFGLDHEEIGFEGIAHNNANGRFYLLIEALAKSRKKCQASIIEYDDEFNFLKHRPLDFTFESDNKGFEAVAHLRRSGEDLLLALCEGNKCRCGAKGRTPGGGRVQMFEKAKKCWRHVDTIALPASLPFVDYSGMSLRGERVAVVSQVNSMLWVGDFNASQMRWSDDGKLYEFPRAADGSIMYGNIEGVAWIDDMSIVAVSDRRKKSTQPDRQLARKDQSIHLFEIPSA